MIYYQLNTKKDFYAVVNIINTAAKEKGNKKIHIDKSDRNSYVTYRYQKWALKK